MGPSFKFLSDILESMGAPFGIDYIHISIYVCIWLWTSICILSAIPFLSASIKRRKSGSHKVGGLAGIIFAAIYILISSTIALYFVLRYPVATPNESFRLCADDLLALGKHFGLSYAEINIIIYIFLFLLLELFWILMYRGMKPRNIKTHLRE